MIDNNTKKLSRSNKITVGGCVSEMMVAAISFHKLHLKVNGMGAYAAHVALNDLYDALPGHADALAEGYQGVTGILLSCPDDCYPRVLTTVQDAISYITELYNMINALQATIPYSEIVNDLDTAKSTLNTAKYKLTFLK
jgi:DNA-binding ferritin-like protein